MKQILLPVILIFSCTVLYSQKKEITIREYFADAEFFFAAEEYVDALQDYLEVYKRGYEESASINYRIGVCYLNIPGQKEKAVNYLLKSCENVSPKYTGTTIHEEFAPIDAYLYLGNTYRVLYEFDKALEGYNTYLGLLPEQASEEKKYAEKQIEAVHIAKEFVHSPATVEFTNMGKLINNNRANHNCVVSGDGSTLVFMTKLPFYEAVYMSKRRGDNWSRPINITPQLMSDGDQFVTGISYEGNTLLLAKQDVFDSDIYISRYENGKWSKSKLISKSINSRYWESHASFSKSGDTIFFTSNRRGGIGGMDIYSVAKEKNGDWGEPVNLGANVNTELNEDTPFISADGKTLYFSSQGHMNMGGYDLFVSYFSDTGWTVPENLHYPLSTTDEDLFYYPENNGERAYIHRILEGGNGHWDIYMVSFPNEMAEEEGVPLAKKTEEEVVEKTEEKVELKKTEFEVAPILFSFDAYTISSESKEVLNSYIKLLGEKKEINLTIIGYTDALGPEAYNQRLSERRAEMVKKFFVEKGVAEERIEVVGMGEKNFIAINKKPNGEDSPEGRRYNRRAEFQFKNVNNTGIIIKIVNIVPEELRVD